MTDTTPNDQGLPDTLLIGRVSPSLSDSRNLSALRSFLLARRIIAATIETPAVDKMATTADLVGCAEFPGLLGTELDSDSSPPSFSLTPITPESGSSSTNLASFSKRKPREFLSFVAAPSTSPETMIAAFAT